MFEFFFQVACILMWVAPVIAFLFPGSVEQRGWRALKAFGYALLFLGSLVVAKIIAGSL